MSEAPPPDRPQGREARPTEIPADGEQRLWRQLAESNDPATFFHSWLVLQSRLIGGVEGGAIVLAAGAGEDRPAPRPIAVWPETFTVTERLAGAIRSAWDEGKGVVTRGDAEARLQLAFPIRVGDRVRGVAALEIAARGPGELESAMRQLQWGAAWPRNWFHRRAASAAPAADAGIAALHEIVALAVEQPRFLGAATAVATELGSRLSFDRVSLGFVSGTRVKVCALSHSAEFAGSMNLIRAIGMAMGEAVDQAALLVYPEPSGGAPHVLHAHERLARDHGDRAICTVPFLDHEGRTFGALTLERSAPSSITADTIRLCDGLAAVLGPILDEKRRNDRWLAVKAWHALRDQLGALVGPRHVARKGITVAALALLAFLATARGAYRITARTTLEGEVQRAVTAPFRGFVADAPARGGDIVKAGQVLCTLDVRDLRLELAKSTSEHEQYAVEHRRALAKRDRAAMNVLSKKMGQAQAQVALLEEQIARATIVAPFDGLVVSGDLSQTLGAPVDAGKVLFEVAPLESYRVVLQVDERDIGAVHEGQRGELLLTALPHERLSFAVVRITPISVPQEGRNYFEVEGKLEQVSQRLRPGMEGFGKIAVGRRKLLWIWTHEMIDWLRLKSWTWSP